MVLNNKHRSLQELIVEKFLNKGFLVQKEIPLPRGKGSVDVFAEKKDLKIYMEVKSSPTSIYSKKARNQLMRYRKFFGKEHFYFLVSPDAEGKIKFSALEE